MSINKIRNIAIIAHVDHGKTTLVDQILNTATTDLKINENVSRVMDSNDLEKERGITIFSKNCSINYDGYTINIVDTPGHSDFGGEVERILNMVDGVLILVDAVDGPMPQTRFVTEKALKRGFTPIVVVNKCDRPEARPNWVVDQTFDLFYKLGASEKQLDFKVFFSSAIKGWCSVLPTLEKKEDFRLLIDQIILNIPSPKFVEKDDFILQVSSIDYSNFLGRLVIGKVISGQIKENQEVLLFNEDNKIEGKHKVTQIQKFYGLDKIKADFATSGEIVILAGLDKATIGTTIGDINLIKGLTKIAIDPPTMTMEFYVNDSPLSGKDGKFVTSRQIFERLSKELLTDVSIRIETSEEKDFFIVYGRGELHFSILVERMRREGFELSIGKPRALTKIINGETFEPIEILTTEIQEDYQGVIIEEIGYRKGELLEISNSHANRVTLVFKIPTRGMIGFQSLFATLTKGTGIFSNVFHDYEKSKGDIKIRKSGFLVSNENGKAVAYAIWKLQDRGRFFISPGDDVYEGMIIGLNNKDNELNVNPIKTKQLTNVRASGKDDSILLTPPIQITLEKAIEQIGNDDLIEITPKVIRLRKKTLLQNMRKRAS